MNSRTVTKPDTDGLAEAWLYEKHIGAGGYITVAHTERPEESWAIRNVRPLTLRTDRKAVLEEAAKVAESWMQSGERKTQSTAWSIARSIRAEGAGK